MINRETRNLYLAVGLGAAIGSFLRFAIGVAIGGGLGLPGFWATGLVNILGSFIITFFAEISGPDGRLLIGPIRRQLVMSGFCGGLTTFSAMALDAFVMLLDRSAASAAIYLGMVLMVSLAATWLGYVLAVRLNR